MSQNEYPLQKGTWTLIAPDGAQWTGDSPMRCLRNEMNARIPASVQLARIQAIANETPDEESALRRRIAELEAALAEARRVTKELMESYLSQMPSFESGKQAQDEWADRRAQAIKDASWLLREGA